MISSRFTESLGSFKPSHQLATVGHGCARTTEAVVTVVPVYCHSYARTTNMQNHNAVSAMSVHMLPNWYRNVNERNNTVSCPAMWRIEALVHPATQMALCSRDVVCFNCNITKVVYTQQYIGCGHINSVDMCLGSTNGITVFGFLPSISSNFH